MERGRGQAGYFPQRLPGNQRAGPANGQAGQVQSSFTGSPVSTNVSISCCTRFVGGDSWCTG